MRLHARLGREAPHARQDDLARVLFEAAQREILRHAGQPAKLPVEGAFARQDVARRAAVDRADAQRRRRRIEAGVHRPRDARRHLVGEAVEIGDERRRALDGVGAELRLRGMRLEPAHGRVEGGDALVRVGDVHQRRLADDDRAGTRQVGAEARDRVERARAGRLLVVAQQDVDGLLQRPRA